MKIDEMLVANHAQHSLENELIKFIGTPINKEDIEKAIINNLNYLKDKGLIIDLDTDSIKIEQLWKSWNCRQKLKWLFYNKIPLIKDMSNEIRRNVEDYNEVLRRINHEDIDLFSEKELPPHLISDPKSIYINDVKIQLNQSIEYLNIEVVLSGDNI